MPIVPASFHFSAMLAAKVMPPGSVMCGLMTNVADSMRATAMVSPSARPRPSIEAEIMPGLANGKIAWRTISQRVAPSARDASMCARGTWRKTSRLIAEIVGSTMIASTIPALRIDRL